MQFKLKIAVVILAAASHVVAAPPATNPSVQPATLPGVSKAEQLFKDGTDAMFQSQYPKAIELLEIANEMV